MAYASYMTHLPMTAPKDAAGKQPLPQGYRLFVDDNFHYMDEDERTCLGEFITYEEALETAKKIVEDSVAKTAGADPLALYKAYTDFGEDPFIIPFGGASPPESKFSAWAYAKSYAEQLASARAQKSAEDAK
jgi:hypothetical protein